MEIYEELENKVLRFGKVDIPVVIDRNGLAWFAAKSVAEALGYSDERQALRIHVEKSEKGSIKNLNVDYDTSLIHPNTIFMNEYGLYSLVMGSRKDGAKEFTKWIRYEVLPSIRKYGFYKIRKGYDTERTQLLRDITYLEKQYKICTNDLKKEDYPDGGMVYAINHSDDYDGENGEEIFRIGMTENMNSMKKIHNTHSLHNRKVEKWMETDDPRRFELCLKSMLFQKRYRDKKDFYICSLAYLKRAFAECVKKFKNMDKIGQKGGGFDFINTRVVMLRRRVGVLEKGIMKCNIKLAE